MFKISFLFEYKLCLKIILAQKRKNALMLLDDISLIEILNEIPKIIVAKVRMLLSFNTMNLIHVKDFANSGEISIPQNNRLKIIGL